MGWGPRDEDTALHMPSTRAAAIARLALQILEPEPPLGLGDKPAPWCTVADVRLIPSPRRATGAARHARALCAGAAPLLLRWLGAGTALSAGLLAFGCGWSLCERIALEPARIKFWREQLIQRCAQTGRSPDMFCVYCYEEEKEYAFMPCGHRCVCARCCERIWGAGRKEGTAKQCPVCHEVIAGAMRVFDA